MHATLLTAPSSASNLFSWRHGQVLVQNGCLAPFFARFFSQAARTELYIHILLPFEHLVYTEKS